MPLSMERVCVDEAGACRLKRANGRNIAKREFSSAKNEAEKEWNNFQRRSISKCIPGRTAWFQRLCCGQRNVGSEATSGVELLARFWWGLVQLGRGRNNDFMPSK